MSQLVDPQESPGFSHQPIQIAISEENAPNPSGVLQSDTAKSNVVAVAPDQRLRRKSMSRRSGQKGQVIRKGRMWHVRFYVDVPGQEKLQRKSLPIGPAVGKDKLTKPEAVRKGSEMIAAMGVNSEMH